MDTILFVNITQWNDTKLYNEGEYVYNNGIIYTALISNVDIEPSANPTYWLMKDPRPELVVNYIVDMTLFHLHKRINPRKIPELRKEAYDEAKSYFEMLKKGEESPPDLPFLDDGEEYIPWGSNPQIEHIY